MKLLATSDLHIGVRGNREALLSVQKRPDDWLIVAGDVGETHEHMRFALGTLSERFGKVMWVPGNHELWTINSEPNPGRGEARYMKLVETCRSLGVLTPEDEWPVWPGDNSGTVLALLFLLYDYTFAPDDVGAAGAVAWAAEERIVCTDEVLLHPDPYPTREAWCHARVEAAVRRLEALGPTTPTVLINHFPLRRDLVFIPRVPRFIPWCGTRLTEDWHQRFHARVVVSGHLHVRTTRMRDGVRFEEVSLGHPGQWRGTGVEDNLREILPGPEGQIAERFWR